MVTFHYPHNTPTTSIELRDPELQDTDKYSVQTTVKTTMDGDLATYIRTPNRDKFQLTFTALSKDVVEDFFNFLSETSGNSVGYTDQNGVLWEVIIFTDPKEFSTVNSCGEFTLTMELVVV